MVNDFALKHGITIVKGMKSLFDGLRTSLPLSEPLSGSRHLIITFMPCGAKRVCFNEPRGITSYLKGYDVRHVNRMQRPRIVVISCAPCRGAKAILTNARCLTEE